MGRFLALSRYTALFMILLALFSSAFTIQDALALTEGEISGLEEIRAAWPFMEDIWTTPATDGCQWKFITCAQDHDTDWHVAELKIEPRNWGASHPTATLPSAISSLFYLQNLSLSLVNLGGCIPDITNLDFLKSIHLEDKYDCALTDALLRLPNTSLTEISFISMMKGFLQDEISKFQKLEKLRLSSHDNELLGYIPTLYPALPNLRHLDLQRTAFRGDIATFLGPQMEFLNFFDTFVDGELSSVCSFPNLTYLSISQTLVSGRIPSCLGMLSKLKFLDISDSLILGPIPGSFAGLPLTHLYIANLPFGGTFPDVLGQLHQLEFLNLSNAGIHGPIPSIVSQMTQLISLQLNANELTGPVPPLPHNLQNIDLAENWLMGDLNFISSSVRPDTHLNLSWNLFAGTIPSHLFDVEVLILSGNLDLMGPLPNGSLNADILGRDEPIDCLSEDLEVACPTLVLPHMVNLNLFQIPLGGILPQLDAPNLQILNISGCRLGGLVGALPPNLELVDMSVNEFNCFLPPTLPLSLRVLQLSYGGFYGPFPSAWDQNDVTRFSLIDLRHNRLVGKMPKFPSFAGELLLSYNVNLTGTLETLMTMPGRVWTLEISNAGLTGTIPSDFLQIAGSSIVDLSQNELKGTIDAIPDSVQILKLNNNMLSGEIYFENNLAQNLVVLDLAHNAFGPKGFDFNAPKLSTLDITNNSFAFDLLDGLQRFPMVQFVLADSNPIYGAILPTSVLQNLKSMSLRNTAINGSLNYQKLDIMLKRGMTFFDISDNPQLVPQPLEEPLAIAPWPKNIGEGQSPSNMECNAITNELSLVAKNRGFPFIFNFDDRLFNFKHCHCIDGSYGLPPACLKCHPTLNCDAFSTLTISNPMFAFIDPSYFSNAPIFGSEAATSPWKGLDQHQLVNKDHLSTALPQTENIAFPIYVEPCAGYESQCQGIAISPDLIFQNSSFIATALSAQCKPGSEGRLCSRCKCSRENPPCYFPQGSGCVQCPKNWKIPSATVFWSVLSIFVVLAYVLLTIIMLIVLRSRRTRVTVPWSKLSLGKRIFNRALHFTELGFIPILVTFAQLLSELTHWDSQLLRWLSTTSKLLSGDVNGFGLWCLNPDFAQPHWSLVGQELLPFGISALFIASVVSAAVLYRLMRDPEWNRKFSCFGSATISKPNSHTSTSDNARMNDDLLEFGAQKSLLSEMGDEETESDIESSNGGENDDDEFESFGRQDEKFKSQTESYPAAALVSSMVFSVFQFFYFSSALAAADAFFTSNQAHTNGRYLISLPWLLYSDTGSLRRLSLVFLILVVIGFPLCSLCLIMYFRSRIYDPKISVFFGSLVTRYRPGFIWWEFVKIAEKLAIAISLRAVGKASILMSGIVAMIIVVFAAAQITLRPWKRGIENSANSISSTLLLMSMLTTGYIQSDQHQLLWPAVAIDMTFIVALVVLGVIYALKEETKYHLRFKAKRNSIQPEAADTTSSTRNGEYIPIMRLSMTRTEANFLSEATDSETDL